MESCECAMWFIGIMVAFFGIIITVFGVFVPFIQNNRLKKIKTSLENQKFELTEFIKTYESTLKGLELKRRELERKEIRKNEIEMELRNEEGLKENDKSTSLFKSKLYARWKEEDLI